MTIERTVIVRQATSAYMMIYNDHDILPHTLRAIAPYADELFVVDGAYEWMVPYFEMLGRNPLRSDDKVYDALEASGIKYRVEARIWDSEITKRMAGYAGCSGRYVFRIDADEVPFFDNPELERFYSSGNPVAQMFIPAYIAPQWLLALDQSGRLPASPFLFDRTRIEPDVHLSYLWLVLEPDQLPNARRQPFAVYQPPIGLSAHLVMWRDLQSATDRSAFYWLNNMRENGVPWLPEMRGRPTTDFKIPFEKTSPEAYREFIQASSLGTQRFRLAGGWRSIRSPLAPELESLFTDRFDCMLEDHVRLNRSMVANGLTFWPGWPIVIDLTTPEAAQAVMADDTIRLSCTCAISTVSAKLHTLVPHDPWHICTELECDHDGSTATVVLPERAEMHLRRELEILLSPKAAEPLRRFQITR